MLSHCDSNVKVTLTILFLPSQDLSGRCGVRDVGCAKRSQAHFKDVKIRPPTNGPSCAVAVQFPERCIPSGHRYRLTLVLIDGQVLSDHVSPLSGKKVLGTVWFIFIHRRTELGVFLQDLVIRDDEVAGTYPGVKSAYCALICAAEMTARKAKLPQHPVRHIEGQSPGFIWETTTAKFERGRQGEVVFPCFQHKFLVDSVDCTECHLSLARRQLRRPLGEPTAQCPKFALALHVNNSLQWDVIKDCYSIYNSSLHGQEICEGSGCVSGTIPPCNFDCLLCKHASVTGYDRLLLIHPEPKRFHLLKITSRRREDTEEIIASDDVWRKRITTSLNGKLVQKTQRGKAERRSHLYTSFGEYALAVRINHLNWFEHLPDVPPCPVGYVKCVEDSSPQCLCIQVWDVVRCVGQVTGDNSPLLVPRSTKHVVELFRSDVLIKVQSTDALDNGLELSPDNISRHKRERWELAEDSSLVTRFRHGEDVDGVLTFAAIFRERRVDDYLVYPLLDFVCTKPRVVAVIWIPNGIQQLAKSATLIYRVVPASRTFRWMEGYLLCEMDTLTLHKIFSKVINLICDTGVRFGNARDDPSMLAKGLVHCPYASFWKHTSQSRNLGTQFCVTRKGGKPLLKCTRHLRLARSDLRPRHGPLTVLECQLLYMRHGTRPVRGSTAHFNEPAGVQLCRHEILKRSSIDSFDDNCCCCPNILCPFDRLGTSLPRRGQCWQVIPAAGPNNTGDNWPRPNAFR
nr:hypothetical protein [Riboviria sp.]